MSARSPSLIPRSQHEGSSEDLAESLRAFADFGRHTKVTRLDSLVGATHFSLPVFINEFWTSKQRAAHSLHEVSYRACFKPQLPRFFIERLTQPGDVVHDPFAGRGTTLLEAALLKRNPVGCDINPLSSALITPRLCPPSLSDVASRLQEVDFDFATEQPEDLLVFYHPQTLRQIGALKHYLATRQSDGDLDAVDAWIRMVALSRLTGHSAGFFSVYTLPPNQAVTVESQRRINAQRNQAPPLRDVPQLILRKTRDLLRDLEEPERQHLATASLRFLTRKAEHTPQIADESVSLVVTSPPFLSVVDYATDNWLRCWFLGIDPQKVPMSVHRRLDDWQTAMTKVFRELHRVLKPGGHIAFEVGEVNGGKVRLEEATIPCGLAAGLEPVLVLINDQHFTKTANCWGVSNNAKGTNTNRVVLFRKIGG